MYIKQASLRTASIFQRIFNHTFSGTCLFTKPQMLGPKFKIFLGTVGPKMTSNFNNSSGPILMLKT